VLEWILLFSVLGSVGAIISAAGFLSLSEKRQTRLIPYLLSYASGTLLTASLLGLIPHALHHLAPRPVLETVLVGVILFFLLEKLLIWHHCHDAQREDHGVSGVMILIGDALHNFTDGVVVSASFLSSFTLGIAASLSILAHEIPQEVGDFALLLHNGYPRRKALFLNMASSLSTLPGAVLAYYMLPLVSNAIPYAMGLSAASFLYISLVDLTPELHREKAIRRAVLQFFLVLTGIGTIMLCLTFHP
jgi:zinc and cadmium transporter